ncbi:CPBP family intramembrane glutamic endopeptidase [Demequina flava]|uniref:CPBP family intramembrane glutamic endopeptidase n=1 Tax=Demequina flava TaxID=1095025 RepID=UPI000781D961|nr:CPBP family intramembrane glutamic endopeptidase [Demequina flava]
MASLGLLRRAGRKELAVAVLSSLIFGLTHIMSGIGSGMTTIVFLVIYTFFFGVAMYFTLRVTRNTIWPILLHASTDPSIMLRSGGVDESTDAAAEAVGLAQIAALGNFVVVGVGLLTVWFIRGQVDRFELFGLGTTKEGVATSAK